MRPGLRESAASALNVPTGASFHVVLTGRDPLCGQRFVELACVSHRRDATAVLFRKPGGNWDLTPQQPYVPAEGETVRYRCYSSSHGIVTGQGQILERSLRPDGTFRVRLRKQAPGDPYDGSTWMFYSGSTVFAPLAAAH